MFHRTVGFNLRLLYGCAVDFLADKPFIHAFINGKKPRSARVYNSCFFQNGKKSRGEVYRLFAFRYYFLKESFKILGLSADSRNVFGNHAADGKNRSFLGLGYRAVRNVRRAFQSFGKRLGVGFVIVL